MFTFENTKKQVARIKGGKLKNVKIFLSTDKTDPKLCFDQLDIHDGMIILTPYFRKFRSCVYCVGHSGVGKSTQACQFAKEYRKKYKNDIIVFSPKDEDESLDSLNALRPLIDEYNLLDEETKLLPEDLSNSLVIIDDIEGIANDNLKKAMRDFRDRLLLLGRSMKISIFITNHLTLDGNRTKIPVKESNFFQFFPGGCCYSTRRYLREYLGLPSKKIDEIMNERSRVITIHTHHPRFIVTKDKISKL